MKLLWVHDHVFYEGDAGIVSFGFPSAVWDRYFSAFEQVTVAARSRPLEPSDDLDRLSSAEREGVRFEFLPSVSSPRGLLRIPRMRHRLAALAREADAVVARLPSELGLLAVGAARRTRTPYALEIVGNARAAYRSLGWVGRLYGPVIDCRVAGAAASAAFALYVTERALQKQYPSRGRQIGCSNVILPDFDPEAQLRRRLQHIESRGNRPISFATIASLHPRKGIEVALEALSRAADRISSFRYRILGQGDPAPWREVATRLGISDRVEFEGTLPAGEAVFDWLDEQDIYLQPSFAEGLPRTLVEAMSRGLPSLGSSIDGIQELLPRTCLHPPGDAEELARQVLEITKPEAQRGRARENLETAQRYAHSVLAERRREFWGEFAMFAAGAGFT